MKNMFRWVDLPSALSAFQKNAAEQGVAAYRHKKSPTKRTAEVLAKVRKKLSAKKDLILGGYEGFCEEIGIAWDAVGFTGRAVEEVRKFKWMSMEHAPRDGSPVIALCLGLAHPVLIKWEGEVWVGYAQEQIIMTPTQFLPLPEAHFPQA